MKSLKKSNRRPIHPGAILREDVLPELGITQAAFANHLGVDRLTLSEVLYEKISVNTEMAGAISRIVGGSPESWLRMQAAVDLWDSFKLKSQINKEDS